MFQYNNKEFYNTKDLAMYAIGGKYKIAIVWAFLENGTLRLSELTKILPDVNQRMLIRQLRELERDQLIQRTIYPVVPPKVEYQLTEIGLELSEIVQAICAWGDKYWQAVREDQ